MHSRAITSNKNTELYDKKKIKKITYTVQTNIKKILEKKKFHKK